MLVFREISLFRYCVPHTHVITRTPFVFSFLKFGSRHKSRFYVTGMRCETPRAENASQASLQAMAWLEV